MEKKIEINEDTPFPEAVKQAYEVYYSNTLKNLFLLMPLLFMVPAPRVFRTHSSRKMPSSEV